MLIDRDGEIIQIRASALGDLVKVVVLQQYGKLDDFKERYNKYGGEDLSKEHIESEWPNWTSRWIIAQTFTAMALEAFYYDYLQNEVSKTQADKKRSPPERFKFICINHLGLEFKNIKPCFEKLVNLNATRTHWVHNKSAVFDSYEKVRDFFSPDECIQILIDVFSIISCNDETCLVARETMSILKHVQANVVSEVESMLPHNKSMQPTANASAD
ncbi:hypothetical protein [Aeromonas veronii]|uniref:hypothetical protein n=1 Tax=Aeromonas veronii TaxID=654 RepID=UPI00227B2F61|nr:hypothetical protein [Aeromonas veronii]